jgi:hypothetical protein
MIWGYASNKRLRTPDLGHFFSMFADKIFNMNFDIKTLHDKNYTVSLQDSTVSHQDSTASLRDYVTIMIVQYFNAFSTEFSNFLEDRSPSCLYAAENVLRDFYDSFIQMIKHSQVCKLCKG